MRPLQTLNAQNPVFVFGSSRSFQICLQTDLILILHVCWNDSSACPGVNEHEPVSDEAEREITPCGRNTSSVLTSVQFSWGAQEVLTSRNFIQAVKHTESSSTTHCSLVASSTKWGFEQWNRWVYVWFTPSHNPHTHIHIFKQILYVLVLTYEINDPNKVIHFHTSLNLTVKIKCFCWSHWGTPECLVCISTRTNKVPTSQLELCPYKYF